MRGYPINPPNINLPTRRVLPVLGYLSADVIKADQDQVILKG